MIKEHDVRKRMYQQVQEFYNMEQAVSRLRHGNTSIDGTLAR